MGERTASVDRNTRETKIQIKLDLDGTGRARVDSGVGFLDHMLELFAKHSLVDLDVTCRGDTNVDYHHTVEDIGLALGTALDQALGDRKGIRRYGFFILPMDESRGEALVDFGGRPFLVYDTECSATFVRDFDTALFREFFRSVAVNARANIQLRHSGGNEAHHASEAMFKAFARAVRMAVEPDPREHGIPSSKGVI